LIKVSEAGERYAAACRRMLIELEEADILAAGERSAPRGTLTLTAPVTSGEQVLRPTLDDFIDAYPMVSASLYLLDRIVKLIDERIDAAMRTVRSTFCSEGPHLLGLRRAALRVRSHALPRVPWPNPYSFEFWKECQPIN
jgi:DNA-binding transcriptional LysR family regulator